jgi:diguanylate cyclase (GGDEF)-like protein
VNGLKQVNDTLGHQAGDRFIKEACKIICDIFKRSPVFRIGGDEFVVIAKGDDYMNMDHLLDQVELMNRRNEPHGGIVIAAGMARSEGSKDIQSIVKRADEKMYENKKWLKMRKGEEK